MGAAPSFEAALQEIGRLTYVWTNTESLLVHVIAGLMGCDKETGLILFLTLNTTRARVDLVERLVKHKGLGDDEMHRLLGLTKKLVQHGAERNRYNHAIYSFDPESGDMSTIQMRIADRRDAIRMGDKRRLDTDAITGLRPSSGSSSACQPMPSRPSRAERPELGAHQRTSRPPVFCLGPLGLDQRRRRLGVVEHGQIAQGDVGAHVTGRARAAELDRIEIAAPAGEDATADQLMLAGGGEGDAPLDISISFPIPVADRPIVLPRLTAHRPVNAIAAVCA